jgi:hypothetical protein
LVRCSKAGHIDAPLTSTFLDNHGEPVVLCIVICTRCQSERLASNDAQAAGNILDAADGMHIGRLCEQYYQTSKDSSAILVGQVIEAQIDAARSTSSEQTTTQILRALQELQQGQRELQNQQLEMKATLHAHIQKVQQQHDASLRHRAKDTKDAAEELERQ